MTQFSKSVVVQLVSDEQVERRREAYRGTWLMFSGVKEPWWRSISLTGTTKGVKLYLASIEEEAAKGGHCNCWYNSREHFFHWDDLFDIDGMAQIFANEQYRVVKAIEKLFVDLQPHVKSLREILAS